MTTLLIIVKNNSNNHISIIKTRIANYDKVLGWAVANGIILKDLINIIIRILNKIEKSKCIEQCRFTKVPRSILSGIVNIVESRYKSNIISYALVRSIIAHYRWRRRCEKRKRKIYTIPPKTKVNNNHNLEEYDMEYIYKYGRNYHQDDDSDRNHSNNI